MLVLEVIWIECLPVKFQNSKRNTFNLLRAITHRSSKPLERKKFTLLSFNIFRTGNLTQEIDNQLKGILEQFIPEGGFQLKPQ
jgi:hypothetical protein